MSFHEKSIEKALLDILTSQGGLTKEEAARRLVQYGPNRISGGHKRTALDILINQFKNFLIWLLIFASVVAFFVGDKIDSIAILAACAVSIIFGFVLEFKADESLRALQSLVVPKALVLRNGKHEVIDASDVVPGDILIIDEGAKLAADCRLIESHGLEVNEALLTGESMPVAKQTGPVDLDTPLHGRANMAYSSTLVVKGHGKAVVIATGNKTEFGQIASALSSVETEQTTLQVALDDLGKKVSTVSFAIIILLMAIGWFEGLQLATLAILAISLAVAAVPEGLLTVLAIILALGTRRMAEKNALVRSMHAVETIGGVTTLIVDKTGTITEGRFDLASVYSNGGIRSIESCKDNKSLVYSVLCNTAKMTDGESGAVGDEIDSAILNAAHSIGIDVHTLKAKKPLAFFPFDTEKKWMSAVFSFGSSVSSLEGKTIAIVKGAPESVLAACDKIEQSGAVMPLKDKKPVHKKIEELAGSGMRIIGIAYREVASANKANKKDLEKEIERPLVFLGLLAFSDMPRKETKDTLSACKAAGISVIMLTGDNLKTAFSIGKAIGLIEHENQAVEWEQIKGCSEFELAAKLKNIKIIARSTPLAKLKVVEVLISQGEVLAVTGDGINDAPALKKAHVGVVMGSGSDVSKEAGSLILLDNNFATLVAAVEYGRLVFHNILSFIRFQFTTTFAMLGLFIGSFALSFFIPIAPLLTPIQILFINIVMDGPPALALGFERALTDVLKEKPRREKSILSNEMLFSISLSALFMLFVMGATYLVYKDSPNLLTMSFLVFSFMQLFNALNCRFAHESFYKEMGSNIYLLASLIGMAILLVAIVYVPAAQTIFKTTVISLQDWGFVLAVSATILVFEELRKRCMFRQCR